MEIFMNTVEEKLKKAQKLITKNISTEEMLEVLKIIGVEMTADEIESYRLWGDYMPLKQSSVSDWENDVSRPDYEKLIALAELYDVTLYELLGID